MAHGTRISGVNKTVTAGLTRINGVNKKVTKGLTLADGVEREILFGGGTYIVTITGTGNASMSYVTINGTKYISAATVEVEAGTIITGQAFSALTIDGVKQTNTKYTLTVNSNVLINMSAAGTTITTS